MVRLRVPTYISSGLISKSNHCCIKSQANLVSSKSPEMLSSRSHSACYFQASLSHRSWGGRPRADSWVVATCCHRHRHRHRHRQRHGAGRGGGTSLSLVARRRRSGGALNRTVAAGRDQMAAAPAVPCVGSAASSARSDGRRRLPSLPPSVGRPGGSHRP